MLKKNVTATMCSTLMWFVWHYVTVGFCKLLQVLEFLWFHGVMVCCCLKFREWNDMLRLRLSCTKKVVLQKKLLHVTYPDHWQVVADLPGKFWAPGVEWLNFQLDYVGFVDFFLLLVDCRTDSSSADLLREGISGQLSRYTPLLVGAPALRRALATRLRLVE